jgi:hypothetical protein
MSKSSKKRRSEERKSAKRKIKAANRARYEQMKLAGVNSKSKRAKKAVKKLARKGRHLSGPCGNIGCKRCSPMFKNTSQQKVLVF